MCWGPEDEREMRDAQEEIRLLFERYRAHPDPPAERLEDDEESLEPEREYTLSA